MNSRTGILVKRGTMIIKICENTATVKAILHSRNPPYKRFTYMFKYFLHSEKFNNTFARF